MKNLSEIAVKIESLFDTFNAKFFDSKLEKPIITLAPAKKKSTLGHFTVNRVWLQGEESQHEINLSAEFLNRPIYNICATLLHEMVHLYCSLNNIKDTSNNNVYHNTRFKEAAEEHGLSISKNRYGWSETELSESTKSYVDSLNLTEFGIFRNSAKFGKTGPATGQKKQSSIKWVCQICGAIVRSTKVVNITCSDCLVPFVRQD